MPLSPPQLINSRCCPCKGRISWAGLAPQYLSRYEPLTGARFINRIQEVGASPYPKYEPPSGALAPQVRDIRAALHGLKAQQVRSPGQRPGLTYVPYLRPVRAKVINNRLPILLPLQGEGLYTLVPRALPWAGDWLPFQGARGAIRHYFPSAATKFVNSINSLLRRLRPNIFRCIPSPSKVLALNPSAPSEDGYFYADIFPGPALEEERQFIVVSAVEKFLGGIAVVRRGA